LPSAGRTNQGQVVETAGSARLAVDPGGDPAHPHASASSSSAKAPLKLVAEAAAAAAHDLVDQVRLIQRDRLGQ